MKRLICLLAAAAPAFSQTVPEPRPMRAVVVSVDVPPAYAGYLDSFAVLSVEEDDGSRSTLYLRYFDPEVPQPGQRCSFDIGPALAKDMVGRELWSVERQVTGVLRVECENKS
jgi:hypothetical protein